MFMYECSYSADFERYHITHASHYLIAARWMAARQPVRSIEGRKNAITVYVRECGSDTTHEYQVWSRVKLVAREVTL